MPTPTRTEGHNLYANKANHNMLILLTSSGTAQTPSRADNWEPFRYFVGIWEGTGTDNQAPQRFNVSIGSF